MEETVKIINVSGKKLLYIIIFILFAIACYFPEHNISSNFQYNYADSEIKALQIKVSELENKQAVTTWNITSLSKNVYPNKAYLKVGSDNYQSLMTDHGMLFISIDDVKDYTNGYKLILKIGNPNGVNFDNVNLLIEYGETFPYKIKEQQLLKSMVANSWNSYEILLVPASQQDLQNIIITPQIRQVSFWKSY